jgi:TRAP-type transport system periplasmic protein
VLRVVPDAALQINEILAELLQPETKREDDGPGRQFRFALLPCGRGVFATCPNVLSDLSLRNSKKGRTKMMVSRHLSRGVTTALFAAMASAFLVVPFPAAAQDKTFVMKLSTATLNDTQHEWMKRFAAAVDKDSGGRIKSEVYPASQLGSIPRQIEGAQFGSIQAWIGPPEFLVGVDQRYEALSAPGMFASQDQDVKVIQDPAVKSMILGLGANKGLAGIALLPLGPSSIVLRNPIRHLAEFKGTKIRVLASPFQMEMIKRMDATGVAMSLGDVLPALQQGAIDGALGTVPVFGPLHYIDAGKYIVEIGQPYVNTIAVMNKKWLEALPSDLQKIVRDDATATAVNIVPFVNDFFEAQRKEWVAKGGELISLPADEQAAFLAKTSTIGDELSKDRPELNEAVKVVMEAAARAK